MWCQAELQFYVLVALTRKLAYYRDADYGPCEVCLLQEDNWQIG